MSPAVISTFLPYTFGLLYGFDRTFYQVQSVSDRLHRTPTSPTHTETEKIRPDEQFCHMTSPRSEAGAGGVTGQAGSKMTTSLAHGKTSVTIPPLGTSTPICQQPSFTKIK